MNSINDIPNENNFESSTPRVCLFALLPLRNTLTPRYQNSTLENSAFTQRHKRAPPTPPQPAPLLYIIVFGYPADKYSLTVEYFRSLGECTEADPNLDIQNCFRIGYTDTGDALRAVRKSGEVLGGSWMIGAKWAVRVFILSFHKV